MEQSIYITKFGLVNQIKGIKFGLANQMFINKPAFTLFMNTNLIKQVILEQNERKLPKNLVIRDIFGRLKSYFSYPQIIVISGVRRCGKSTLLLQMKSLYDGYYVNFDDERFVGFSVQDFTKLNELLIEIYGEKNTYYFDEIQNILGWERFVRRLFDSNKKVFVSGSNATMLSKELGTHLTGRNIPITVFPFSFNEYLTYKGDSFDYNSLTSEKSALIKRNFNHYLVLGGFPEYLFSEDDEYLKAMFQNILYRDIIARYSIKDEKAIKEIIYYAVSNIGKEISFNSLKKLANLSSATSVRQYFEFFDNCYLAFLIQRFDKSLSKQIYFNKKIYFIDPAMARILGFRMSEDYGRYLENIVFLHLKRMGREIFFHKGNHECDFILREGIKITQAIQVTKEIEKQGSQKEREITGLMEAMASYKLKTGLILTFDQEDEILIKDKKILIRPLWKWLLTDQNIS
jgi:predicted AAA+ superfamily ATPase